MDDGTLDLEPEAEELARLASLGEVPGKPTIPGYELQEVLGSGTFGEVWSGIQLSTSQKVAIKTLHQTDLGSVLYLQNEVTRLANLGEHPHVLSLLDANLKNKPAFLVTPRLQSSLESHVSGQVSIAQVVDWMEEVAQALVYIHGRGILHCDLKPSNLLLDQQNRVRVVDFGQAHLLEESGVSLGTLWFMPPEQIPTAGRRPIPEVSWDVYAWGATLYCLLTGKNPRFTVEGQEAIRRHTEPRQQLEVYRRLLRENPLVPVRALNRGVDRDLAAIVHKALEPNAEQRYRSAGEILAELSRRRRRVPVQARPRRVDYVARRFLLRNWLACTLFVLGAGALAWTGRQLLEARAGEARNHARAETGEALQLVAEGSPRGLLRLASAVALDPTYPPARLHFAAVYRSTLKSGLQLLGTGQESLLVAPELILYVNAGGPGQVMGYSESGALLRRFNFGPLPVNCSLSEDGRWLVALDPKGTVSVAEVVLPPKPKDGSNGFRPAAPPAEVGSNRVRSLEPVPVVSARISRDGKGLLLGRKDGLVVWKDDKPGPSWRHSGPVTHTLLSADGRLAATASQTGEVCLFDLKARKRLRFWKGGAPLVGLGWGAKPDTLVAGFRDGRLLELSAAGPQRLWRKDGRLNGMGWAGNGRFLAWGGSVAQVWGNDGVLLTQVSTDSPVHSARLNQDGSLLLTGQGNGRVRLWNVATGQPAALPLNRSVPIRELGFLPGQKTFALLTSALETWSYADSLPPGQECPTPGLRTLAWNRTGRWLAVADAQSVRILSGDGAPGETTIQPEIVVTSLHGTPEGQLVVLGWAPGSKGEREALPPSAVRGPGDRLERWKVEGGKPTRIESRRLGAQTACSLNSGWVCSWSPQVPEVEAQALSDRPAVWKVRVSEKGKVLAAAVGNDGEALAAVTLGPGGMRLNLAGKGDKAPPLSVQVAAAPVCLRLCQDGVFLGSNTQAWFYDRTLKLVWTQKYPYHGRVAGSSSNDLPQWRGYAFDTTGQTAVCYGIEQSIWLRTKTGEVIRHLWDGRTMNACLSEDGAWLCLMGGQGASLYGHSWSTQVPFSGVIGYHSGCFRPGGGSLALVAGMASHVYPVELDLAPSASQLVQLAERRTGRFLKNNQMYRYTDSVHDSMDGPGEKE